MLLGELELRRRREVLKRALRVRTFDVRVHAAESQIGTHRWPWVTPSDDAVSHVLD